MKRVFSYLFLFIVISAAVTGCNANDFPTQSDDIGRIQETDLSGDQPAEESEPQSQVRSEEQLEPQSQVMPEGKTGDVVLGIGMSWLSPKVEEAIVRFNKTNPDGRIEVVEYMSEGVQEGFNRLNADILSGNGPDLLLFDQRELPIQLYAAKGLLEDLNPYLNGDHTIQQTDYLEHILRINEKDGVLNSIPFTFFVQSLAGKASVLEGRTQWNMDEMIAFADRLEETAFMFEYPTKTEAMNICLKANKDYIVDWSSETDNGFHRDFFIKMLEFSNRFIEDDQYDYSSMLDLRAMDGELELIIGGSLDDSQIYGAWFGEPLVYIGYPSEEGNGSVAVVQSVAISSSCEAKGTAWKFVASLLSEEVQDNMDLNPVRRSSLEKLIDQVSGGSSRGQSNWSVTPIELKSPTEEDKQAYWDLINGVRRAETGMDLQIEQIIAEEAESYFSGSKTAEEVADIVENRIEIYVSETK